MRLPRGLVARLLLAQLAVVGVAGLALIATAAIVGPQLFTEHLRHTGESSPIVIQHAEEAFASSFAIALAVSLLMALITAGLVALLVVRRIAASVTDLADAADAIAAGDYGVTVPSGGFGTEMTRLSGAFARMAQRLAATEAARTGMLADLSHELRTPLATLEAYIDGMEDQVVPADQASYAVMRDQVGRLRRLAVDVREASAAEEHARRPGERAGSAGAAGSGGLRADTRGHCRRRCGAGAHEKWPAAPAPRPIPLSRLCPPSGRRQDPPPVRSLCHSRPAAGGRRYR